MDPEEPRVGPWSLSNSRAYILITVIYFVVGVGIAGLLKLVEYYRDYDDFRNITGSIVIGFILGVMWLLSILRIRKASSESREKSTSR